MRLAGKAMVIHAMRLAKRCHREGRILQQITFLYCCLSILLDRFTLTTKSIFLVAFYFYNKGEPMTNFFRTTM